MIRFDIHRTPNHRGPSVLGHLYKGADDILNVFFYYGLVLEPTDYLSSVTVTAALLSDRTTDSNAIFASTTATIFSGTADDGTATQLETAAINNRVRGLREGDLIYNATENYIGRVTGFTTGNTLNDTIIFEQVDGSTGNPTMASDQYYAPLAQCRIIATAEDTDYYCQVVAVSNGGPGNTANAMTFIDTFIVHSGETQAVSP